MLDPRDMAEDALREEVKQLRARLAELTGQAAGLPSAISSVEILDRLHDAVIITDDAWRISYWNRAAEQLYGWPRAEAIGVSMGVVAPVSRYIGGGDGQSAQADLRERGVWHGEVVQRRRDGGELFIDASVQMIAGAPGQGAVYLAINRDIGERVRAEAQHALETQRAAEALLASEERFRMIIEQNLDAVALSDRHGRLHYVSPAITRILGYTPAQLVGRDASTLIEPSDLERLQPQAARPEGSAFETVVLRARHVNGDWRWIEVVRNNQTDNPTIGFVIATIHDITQQKQAEEALRESEERLRLALQAANQGLYDLDLPSGEAKVSAEYATMLGYDPATFHETNAAWLERMHPDDLPLAQEAFRAYVAGESSVYAVEFRQRTQGGDWKWLLSLGKIVAWDDEGRPLRMMGTHTDLTARKQVEEELRRAADRLRGLHIIDQAILSAQSPVQVAEVVAEHLRTMLPCDQATILAYDANHTRLRLLASESVDGQPVPTGTSFFVGERSAQNAVWFGQPWRVGDVARAPQLAEQAAGLTQRGVRSMLYSPLIVQSELIGALVLTSTATDAFSDEHAAITAEIADQLAIGLQSTRLLVQLEQERAQLARRIAERTADLNAANGELARAARLKDEFLANMSHELRTPLNAILGRCELLREQIHGPLGERQQQTVTAIEEAGRHLLELINDILDLSKIEAGQLALEPAVIEVDALCRASTRLVAQMALVGRIPMALSIDSQVDTFIGDERRLKQILVNLLSNAVKFTPSGGRVGLDVRGDAERQVVTFTVWDTGIGIAPEDQPRLFQPFVQIDSSLSRQYNGTGLGLALVLRLTELHGGSVTLESAPGKGSRFSVALPWTKALAGARGPAGAKPEPGGAPLPPIRQTLVIDDSYTAIEQITRYLSELGGEVVAHEQAAGAVERARELKPDLIVLDILLPDRPGWEVLRQLKADPETAGIPVLVVSVVDDLARARELGAAGFVLKPLSREVFLIALQTIYASEAAGPPSIPLTMVVANGDAAQAPMVLIVDDNEDNLEVLIDYLQSGGYTVAVAHNGAEAVALAEDLRPALILMDIQMPVMDGLEATRRIRAAGMTSTPIIALTALAMRGDRERCLEAGATDYLPKPISLRTLLAMIKAQLEQAALGAGAER